MPPILNAQAVSKRYGARVLFDRVSFVVSDDDRIGLVGPNGAGKSTLLAILARAEEPDSGEVSVRKRARVGTVAQTSGFAPGETVRQVLQRALDRSGLPENEHEQRLRQMFGETGFPDENAEATTLSGGWRKRLAIAEGAIAEPDVLLLDEPTNHLDLQGIEWLEDLIAMLPCACVIVSHDRYFLEAVSNQTVELNRIYAGGLLRVNGSYSRFLEERELYLEAQSKQQESLRNRVKTEVEWLRRGPKARTTKSKARIERAHEMIGELAGMNTRLQRAGVGIDFSATDRQTKRLVEFEQVSLRFDDRQIVRDLDLVITAGARIGLAGPNGSGKTSLLRLLTGDLEPGSGTIKRAHALRVVYFSQARELDTAVTLRRALAPEGDSVVHNGRVIHVASWAARFLFSGEQLNQPVERLSGGERARVLVARLMLQPADLLLLDEPTNDLDIPTLELLEENLLEYPGAMVLVTHDRYMLNRISTTVLGLNGRGDAAQFADFAQWEDWMQQPAAPSPAIAVAVPVFEQAGAKKKLSYLEQREWSGLEGRIASAEERAAAADLALSNPAIAIDAVSLQAALTEQAEAHAEVGALYARWENLAQHAVD